MPDPLKPLATDYLDPAGIYGVNVAPNHQMGAYTQLGHDNSYEVDTGWIDLPVAYNNSASATQEDTVRVKLYNPQYRKVVKYKAVRNSRPPMVPDLENTTKSTLDPTSVSLTAAGQQPPVLHGFTYSVSAPFSIGEGGDPMWTTELVASYSIAKEKLFLDSGDLTGAGTSWSSGTIKTQYFPKLPNDSNTRVIPSNVIDAYIFTTETGPGTDIGAYFYSGTPATDPYRGF